MAVTPRSFRDHFPEFEDTEDEVVEAELAKALIMCPLNPWGQFQDQGIELTAAKGLALSPYGRDMREVSAMGATVYDIRLAQLQHIVAVGGRVI